MGFPYGKAMSEWRRHQRKPLCEYCGVEDMGKQNCSSCGAPGKVYAAHKNHVEELFGVEPKPAHLAT